MIFFVRIGQDRNHDPC